jgi:hypothetical protein
MRILLWIIVGLIPAGVVTYVLVFPRNMFVSLNRPGGGRVTFSKTSVSFERAADHYATNGFEHIDAYVSRLIGPSKDFKFLSMFTPDGMRGFGLDAKDGVIKASFMPDWRKEPEREAAIRSFFNALNVAPTQDYLAGNGGVADATRVLSYPLKGNAVEVTALTKRILQELCGVSPSEALDISYKEK